MIVLHVHGCNIKRINGLSTIPLHLSVSLPLLHSQPCFESQDSRHFTTILFHANWISMTTDGVCGQTWRKRKRGVRSDLGMGGEVASWEQIIYISMPGWHVLDVGSTSEDWSRCFIYMWTLEWSASLSVKSLSVEKKPSCVWILTRCLTKMFSSMSVDCIQLNLIPTG